MASVSPAPRRRLGSAPRLPPTARAGGAGLGGVDVALTTAADRARRLWSEPRSATVRFRLVKIDVTIDVIAQAQRMLAHQPLGPFSIARLERRHDLLVINDRALGTILFKDRPLADGAHVEEEI